MDSSNIQALVTGGSSGIGLETARLIIKNGGKAVIAARNEERLQQAADKIDATAVRCDVGNEDDVINLIQATDDTLDNFNVLINNAGFGSHEALVDTSAEEMKNVLQTNTIGAMMVARESAKIFIENDYGNIVNISSSSGKRGYAGGTSYVASKFALSGMTQCWRDELRPHNIRVMQVNPSEVQTPFFESAGADERTFNETKLIAEDIAQTICDMLGMHDRGFITETSVWATNPQ